MRIGCLSTDPGIAWGGARGADQSISRRSSRRSARRASRCSCSSAASPRRRRHRPWASRSSRFPARARGWPAGALLVAEQPLADWLVDRLRAFGADALYERIALHSAAGSAAARALGIPHLVELNAPLPEEAARYRRLDHPDEAERLERETLSRADLVLPVSSPLAAYARERGAQRVEVTPNAVVPERFADLPDRDPSAAPVAVFSGALRPWHGIETIAEAWALLERRGPCDCG